MDNNRAHAMIPLQTLVDLAYKILGFLGLRDENHLYKALIDNSFLDHDSIEFGRVWPMIFKNAIWLEKVVEAGLKPALIGFRLAALYNGERNTRANLALVISDQVRDSGFIKDLLFASLHDHKFDKRTCEVRFKSRISLNIFDVINSKEGIMTANPGRLFQRGSRGIFSTALYYGERTLRIVEPQCIGGMYGVGPKDLSEVRDICAVKLQFANGKVVYRSFIKRGATTKVVPIKQGESGQIVAYRPPLFGEVGTTVEEFC